MYMWRVLNKYCLNQSGTSLELLSVVTANAPFLDPWSQWRAPTGAGVQGKHSRVTCQPFYPSGRTIRSEQTVQTQISFTPNPCTYWQAQQEHGSRAKDSFSIPPSSLNIMQQGFPMKFIKPIIVGLFGNTMAANAFFLDSRTQWRAPTGAEVQGKTPASTHILVHHRIYPSDRTINPKQTVQTQNRKRGIRSGSTLIVQYTRVPRHTNIQSNLC